MVFISGILFMSKKASRSFVDNLRIHIKGGGGGQGLPKFGGIGGRGGHVFVVAKEGATLKGIRSRYPTQRLTAANGDNSCGRALQGPPGVDLEIEVPPGVCVNTHNGSLIGEVNKVGEKVLVARGGYGGCSENGFLGEKGHSHVINLDLKLIADIGLVGFPNAGKSTLLAALSRARPKIASYPFTTIQPQLGIMCYEDHRQISVADLPGLIEGAHVNIGMGHKFLKHIERTKLLLFVVDIHGFRLNAQYELRSALENVLLLNKELELYREDLLDKPAVLVLNKIDVEGSDDLIADLLHKVKNLREVVIEVDKQFRPSRLVSFDDIFVTSAKRRVNTESLKTRLRELLDLYADIALAKHSPVCDVQTDVVEQYGQRGV